MAKRGFKITTIEEHARAFGYRTPGKSGVGIYLMGTEIHGHVCERGPFPIGRCPGCFQTIKKRRGLDWFVPSVVLAPSEWPLPKCDPELADLACPLCVPPAGRHGLIWVEPLFYKTPIEFTKEAESAGVARKVLDIPREFNLGQDWVYVAHSKAVDAEEDGENSHAIICAFKPFAIDLVVGTDDPDKIPQRARVLATVYGNLARLVHIVRKDEQTEMDDGTVMEFPGKTNDGSSDFGPDEETEA